MSAVISYCTMCNRPFKGTGTCEVCYTIMEQATVKVDEPTEGLVEVRITKAVLAILLKLIRKADLTPSELDLIEDFYNKNC